jgi:hypothetical protein
LPAAAGTVFVALIVTYVYVVIRPVKCDNLVEKNKKMVYNNIKKYMR